MFKFTLMFSVLYLLAWWIFRATPEWIGGMWIYSAIGLVADIAVIYFSLRHFRQRVTPRSRPHLN